MKSKKGVLSNIKSLWGLTLLVMLSFVLISAQNDGFRWLDKQLFSIASVLLSDGKRNNDVVVIDTDKISVENANEKSYVSLVRNILASKALNIVLVDGQLPTSRSDEKQSAVLRKRLSDLQKDIKGKKYKNTRKELRNINRDMAALFSGTDSIASLLSDKRLVLAVPVRRNVRFMASPAVTVPVKWPEDSKPLGVYLIDYPLLGVPPENHLEVTENSAWGRIKAFPVMDNITNDIYRPLLWQQEQAFYLDLVGYLYGRLEKSEVKAWHDTVGVKYLSKVVNTDIRGNIIPLSSGAVSDLADIPVYAPGDVNRDVVSGLKNKVVLIGSNYRNRLSDIAAAINNMRENNIYHVPAWSLLAGLLLPIAVFLYLFFIMPKISTSVELVLALFAVFVLLTIEFGTLLLKGSWLPLSTVFAYLIAGHITSFIKKSSDKKLDTLQDRVHEVSWALCLGQFEKGELDQAFESLKNCHLSDKVLDKYYNIGLEFERQREYDKACLVYNHLKSFKSGYKDIEKRIVTLTNVNGEQPAIISPFSGEKTLVMSDRDIEKPVIGRYELIRELGRGEMGIVYLGKDPKINREVAIKTLNFLQFDKGELKTVRERFFREAETAGKLSHPNIVTIYDVGDERDLAFIAMDYVPGKDMSSFVQQENLLPVHTVLACISKVAEALDYAHNQGVVHRDIKPGNIIYHEQTELVKVTDFGIARIMDTANTRTGTILGSPAYMSPEQLAGKKVGGTADLFSLGATLYQLLTGEFPFKGDSIAELAYKIANEKHRPIRDIRQELPRNITRLINKALNKDAGKRFSSGADMKDALDRIIEEL